MAGMVQPRPLCRLCCSCMHIRLLRCRQTGLLDCMQICLLGCMQTTLVGLLLHSVSKRCGLCKNLSTPTTQQCSCQASNLPPNNQVCKTPDLSHIAQLHWLILCVAFVMTCKATTNASAHLAWLHNLQTPQGNKMTFVPTAQIPNPSQAHQTKAGSPAPQGASLPPTIQQAAFSTAAAATQV